MCGPAYEVPSHVCCTIDQVKALNDQLSQAAPLIASCPACINNFRSFYCDFTCSPDQAQFLKVTRTQKTTEGKDAVKSIDYAVSQRFADGFYDSCKSVQFGATNGFAMDLIGGGAKNASAFLKYMGDERPGLGSPFQIDFPISDDSKYARKPLNCADIKNQNAHCACVDCPDVCPALPPPPSHGKCTVGAVSCLTFSLLIIYSVVLVAAIIWLAARSFWSRRKASYERVSLDAPLSPTISGLDGLVGRGDDSESGPSGSVHFRLGRGASLLDPMEHMQPKQNAINATLRRFFYRLGLVCAKRPVATFAIWAVIIAALNVGWKDFSVETDPVRLWVSPSSEAAQQREFFDKEFGPFFRSEQLFVSHKDGSTVMDRDTIQWWLDTEDQINKLNYQGSTLEKVCFAPGGDACVVQSISAWTGYELGDDWAKRIDRCAKHPAECLPDFGQPLDPKLVLGGANGDWLNASALVITYVVNNFEEGDKHLAMPEKWERGLESFIGKLHVPDGIRLSYSTGVSLEEQLNKSTNTDVRTVVLSYLAMFLYVSLTLGRGIPPSVIDSLIAHVVHRVQNAAHKVGLPVEESNPATLPEFSLWSIPASILINSKFSLGLFGIAIVLISVASSVGLFSLLGIKVTLIIAEVIPFLVLAVGVDNVFILVHELDRQNILHAPPVDFSDDDDALSERTSLPAEERCARAVAKMGPSILLSSTTEVAAFALGTLVPMPAVRNFAIYAAGSVLLAALMQVTVFVSAMTLDLKRAEAMRMDVVPCVCIRPPVGLYDDAPAAEDIVTRFVRVIYAPTLLKKHVKLLVVAFFGGIFVASVIGIQHINLGLDQRLALPADSYLVPYFNDVDRFLDVGPPVYFVVTDDNVAERKGQQELCGRFTTCEELSVVNTLEAERKRPSTSYLAAPPASWIDDFLQWTNPAFDSCCRVRKADPSVFCRARDSDRLCQPCFKGHEWDSTMAGLPVGTDVDHYLRQWLASPADENCPLGGKQAYSSAIALTNHTEYPVYTSHFRTFHTPLRTQGDFISALASAKRICSDLASRGVKVFAYSLFYVFFDQYAYIVPMTFEVLCICLLAILCVSSILLGSWRTGATVTFSCALTVVTVMGAMGFWGISLNAISLVNLVISLGIAVEFNSHLARVFMGSGGYDRSPSNKERDERVWAALSDVGASILCGITITKLNGIAILAFTTSKILEVYYFRMWLVLIIAGAAHGLVLLPVLLSWTGGQGFAIEDTDEEWVTSQMHRPGEYEYAPFADDEDD